MFVRWTSRARRTSEFGGPDRWGEPDVHHRAILAEAVRIDGKPRQRHVAYLVGFTESRARTAHQRVNIWDEISERLDKLGDRITDRKKIEAAVAIKLPRPTAAERRNARRRNARNRKWFAAFRGA